MANQMRRNTSNYIQFNEMTKSKKRSPKRRQKLSSDFYKITKLNNTSIYRSLRDAFIFSTIPAIMDKTFRYGARLGPICGPAPDPTWVGESARNEQT